MSTDAICLIICLAILGISGLIFILHGVALQKEWETDDDYCSFEEQYEPVVRCKNCRRNGTWFCPFNEQAGEIVERDDRDYCSWGVRKGGGENG